jgi:3',5'-cyclic AMP phosphodiesterase CpdA
MIRLLHFSDIHVTTAQPGTSWRDWCNKRLMGWFNVHLLGRGARLAQAEALTRLLRAEILQRRPDAVIFTGDASLFGFPAEIEQAAGLLGLPGDAPCPGIAVPGNHDYYVSAAAQAGAFERLFSPWQQGVRLTYRRYPFACRVGSVWLIAVHAARPHVGFWDASGTVGLTQWQDLEQLCRRLEPGLRIVVCHYPLLTEKRRPEAWHRRLRDAPSACRWIQQCHIALWLHGHRHYWYYLPADESLPCPTIGAGSATQRGQAGYLEYRLDGSVLYALRRAYDPGRGIFRDTEEFQLTLPAEIAGSA